MDWRKASSALAQIAPWIAGTFGSPVAGVAVKALVDVFGLSEDQATPETITAALAGASPQQLQDLRAAELKHAEFMQQIGYTNIEQLAISEVADRDSARNRQINLKDRTPDLLAALSVIVFLSIMAYMAFGQAPAEPMRDGFLMMAGAAIATYKDVYGYFFGSSKGSQGKDAVIQSMAAGGDK